jgi:hypothetical protein
LWPTRSTCRYERLLDAAAKSGIEDALNVRQLA